MSRAILIAACLCVLTGCGLVHRHAQNAPGLGAVGEQPDKVLYEKATNEIQHGRYDVGRLTLQTMINTYPDSEYLAKAKLAIADSYYKEGGVSGLTQAETEYKDFITFFPTAPEAPEAQFRVGMAHFHLMGKPDRDRQEALLAEAELKEFLLKYPDSPLMPRAKARLREVQEVLGDGDYRIAHFYFMKGAMLAARSRFQEIIDQYPTFSQADAALWYLGQSLERTKQPSKAATCYSQLVSTYPLSDHMNEAKARLTALHQPIPQPTKAVMARARADALHRPKSGLMARVTETMSSAPDYSTTRHGPVQLKPAKPAQTQTARGPSAAPSGNVISVQTVPDSALNSGTAADPKPPEKPGTGAPNPQNASTNPNESRQDAPSNPAVSGSDPSSGPSTSGGGSNAPQDVPAPKKKKGKLHFFKKVIP